MDYGESKNPIGPPPASPTTRPDQADLIEATTRTFLAGYWAPPDGFTYGQLAELLAPVATDDVLAPYRDPARAEDPVTLGSPVSTEAITITSVEGSTAAVAAKGTRPDGGVVWRTLSLVLDETEAWKISTVQ